jgi:hypothetical protein
MGLDISMHEALSRLWELHHHWLPQNSVFREFGRHDGNREAIYTPRNRNGMNFFDKHIEDMEIHSVHMGKILKMEMDGSEQAKVVVQMQGLEMETQHTLVETMG